MYRRDLLTAEIQKLAQALARIMGLRLQGKLVEAEQGIDDILENDFGILYPDLLKCNIADFGSFLIERDFPVEKLDLFSQLLYLRFDPLVLAEDNKSLAEKLLLIYQILENKFHVINMINIDRQQKTQQYLNTY
jgi:hypothetical protein